MLMCNVFLLATFLFYIVLEKKNSETEVKENKAHSTSSVD